VLKTAPWPFLVAVGVIGNADADTDADAARPTGKAPEIQRVGRDFLFTLVCARGRTGK
jgi:hypothetical protein